MHSLTNAFACFITLRSWEKGKGDFIQSSCSHSNHNRTCIYVDVTASQMIIVRPDS